MSRFTTVDEPTEVLPQSELERTSTPTPTPTPTQTQVDDSPILVVTSGGLKTRFKSADVQAHDFRHTAFLSSGELRKIRTRHEEFIRSLAAQLSVYLRMEVTLQVSDLQTISFQKYTEGLASPTHLTLFKIEPLKGVCLLNLSPRLGLTIVDRLLGGPAQSVNLSRELSELETALLDQVGQIVLNEWCQLWPKLNALRPVLLGHENNGRFLTSSPYDCIMLVLSIGVKFGECTEPMELVFPFHTIEPVVRQPEPTTTAESNTAPTRLGLSSWNPNLDDVEVQLDIEWHGLELSAGALSRLKCGDVLMLEENCFDRVEVQLAQQHKFKGRLGSTGDRWAVELTEIVKP